ncbi:MAG TPA: sugar-binding protein [Prolixibacteraceae bacterium]
MKKIFTLLLSVFAVTFAMAEAPTGVFAKASVAPVVDGVIDAVWAEATEYNIERVVGTNTPTIGTPGQTTWKGMWTKEGVYVLIQETDNAFYPNYVAGSGLNDYDYDKLELYFDVNYVLLDAKGPSVGGSGHIQIAPGFKLDKNDGTLFTGTDGVKNAFMVEGSHYIAEYFVPYTKLVDLDGAQVDKTNTIGFDVTVIDRDPGDTQRNSAVWSNEGAAGESWANMDDCGRVTFADAEAGIPVDNVVIAPAAGTITVDKGTLQMTSTVTPEDATNMVVKWVLVGGTAQATLSSSGLITAVTNGTIIVKAVATDGSFSESQEVTVTITNQTRIKYTDDTWNTSNIIKNWNFDTDVSEWGGWVDGALAGQSAPVVTDGVLVMKTAKSGAGEAWHYQHNQINLGAEQGVEYTLMFKSWSTGVSVCDVDFEDTDVLSYHRYGKSTDPEAINGESDWKYNVTTIPSWFTFHVTFTDLVETSVQKIQYMISLSNETIYLDSVLLVKTEDMKVVTGLASKLSNSMKVYTRDNVLNVQLSSAVNTKVAIYNAIGQKMMEKVSTGNMAKFDINGLRKGMYFVRLTDGSTQKFIR